MSYTRLSHTTSGRNPTGSLRDAGTRKHTRLRHRRLQAERLEDRRLLAGSPLDSIPALHSNVGASASLYLDFDGHFQAVYGSYTNVTTLAYDNDGDALTFSDAELANIRAIWETVAEDFAPFNIDVTTVQPPVLAPNIPIADANQVALRVAIGADVDDFSTYSTASAYLNSFTSSVANVSYVFPKTTWGVYSIAHMATWGAGRSFGLTDQSLQLVGHAYPLMWPVVGADAFSTWSNGTTLANTLQDDMAILANTTNGFGYRSDDHGNTIASATPLTKVQDTWSNAGIVATSSDADVFSFSVTADDTYRITANRAAVSPNLDAVLELRNSAGQLIASANPQDTSNAEIVTVLAAGDYYLSVMSTGVYGRVGQYTVIVDVPQAAIIVATPTPAVTTGEDGRQASFSIVLHTQPVADVVIAVRSDNTAEGTVSVSSVIFTPANWDVAQTVTVTGVDDAVNDEDVAYSIGLAAAVSSDPNYQGVNPADVAAVNLDNEPLTTKFYVVNDASQNHTYEYNYGGGSIESYLLNSGNTAPRGAASTMAGNKTWVVDANRKVYVYNNSGGLLGSWTAGTLSTKAKVEGIATNGTDIWIVDAYSDKVFKYTGAATRLSSSQNAASSFSLNSSNTNPKDIVTDGTSLWVVDDNIYDKVFKYTITGTLAGSWTSYGGGSPTGITLDPANVSNLWIVDSASDRVYQYNAAASRTWGSQYPAASFALAVGNTNPQGIADPPAPSAELSAAPVVVADVVVSETLLVATWDNPSLPRTSLELPTAACDSGMHRAATTSRDVDVVMIRLGNAVAPTQRDMYTGRTVQVNSRRVIHNAHIELLTDELQVAIGLIADELAVAGPHRR